MPPASLTVHQSDPVRRPSHHEGEEDEAGRIQQQVGKMEDAPSHATNRLKVKFSFRPQFHETFNIVVPENYLTKLSCLIGLYVRNKQGGKDEQIIKKNVRQQWNPR